MPGEVADHLLVAWVFGYRVRFVVDAVRGRIREACLGDHTVFLQVGEDRTRVSPHAGPHIRKAGRDVLLLGEVEVPEVILFEVVFCLHRTDCRMGIAGPADCLILYHREPVIPLPLAVVKLCGEYGGAADIAGQRAGPATVDVLFIAAFYAVIAVTCISIAILVGVLLVGIVDIRAVVARIAHPFVVGVLLVGIGDRRAVVTRISPPVLVGVLLVGIDDIRAVVACIPDPVADMDRDTDRRRVDAGRRSALHFDLRVELIGIRDVRAVVLDIKDAVLVGIL